MNQAHLEYLIANINRHIESLRLPTEPAELYDPIRYFMSLGGKRLRPVLCILTYQLFKNDWETIIKPATALEIFHNFTLLHDDIMDNAPLRRGKPTVHEKWNKNIAILSGDAMLIIAYEQFRELAPDLYQETLAYFNQTAIEVCEGQQVDMNFESQNHVGIDDYLNMIRRKTAVLLGLSCRLGAMFAGQHHNIHDKLAEFGINSGIAFQLKDDLLDVFGDPVKVGKQVGGDIIQNKKTYLLIKALELAKGAQKNELLHWLSVPSFNPEEKVASVKSIYNALGIEQLTETVASDYINKAMQCLDELSDYAPNQEAIDNLKEFATRLLQRTT